MIHDHAEPVSDSEFFIGNHAANGSKCAYTHDNAPVDGFSHGTLYIQEWFAVDVDQCHKDQHQNKPEALSDAIYDIIAWHGFGKPDHNNGVSNSDQEDQEGY